MAGYTAIPTVHAAQSTPMQAVDMPRPVPGVAPDQDDLPWASYVFAVWNLIIRPPRCRYTEDELVGKYPRGIFKVKDTRIQRKDFMVVNARGLRLACTVFEPCVDPPQTEKACVVYCHGNSASRLAGFQLIEILGPLNIGLVCFDFAGSGWSDGDYVSLGFHEKDDLSAVIQHLRAEQGFTRVGIWGYSMGASTCLMHAARDTSLAGVLVDSPFADLQDLIQEICCDQMRLPSFLINSFLPLVRHAIQNKAHFNIDDVSPRKHVENCFIPALLLHGDADDFVAPYHSSTLESQYTGESMRLIMPDITHGSRRPLGFMERAAVFFVRALRWEPFLPSGITEVDLSDRARLHMQPRSSLTHMQPRFRRLVKEEISRLLDSSAPAEQTLGLVQAACKLCGTYRGAMVLPTNAVNLMDAWSPVRYTGNLVLGGEDTEVALCWSRRAADDESCTGCNGEDFREVYFAMLSPTTISLTRVTLAPCKSLDNALAWLKTTSNQINRSKPLAGLACVSVETLDLSTVVLTPFKPHKISLRFLEGKTELAAGGVTVSAQLKTSREVPHVWCMHWKSRGMDQGPGQPTSLQLKCIKDVDSVVHLGDAVAGPQGPRMMISPGPISPASFSPAPFENIAECLSALCSERERAAALCSECLPLPSLAEASPTFKFTDSDGEVITLKKGEDAIYVHITGYDDVGTWDDFDENTGTYYAGHTMLDTILRCGQVPQDSILGVKAFLKTAASQPLCGSDNFDEFHASIRRARTAMLDTLSFSGVDRKHYRSHMLDEGLIAV